MKIRKAGQSIQWKIILLYCMLVFLATTIIGVFLLNQLEEYYVSSVRTNMEKTVTEGTLMTSLSTLLPLQENKEEIQANVEAWTKTLPQEIFVIDGDLQIVASNNANRGRSAVGILDNGLLLYALSGKTGQAQGHIVSGGSEIPVMSMVFPIKSAEKQTDGILYLRADMSSTQDAMDQSKKILVRAMMIGLFVTFLLSYLISKSITEPINDLTERAEKMSTGDFSEEIKAKSDDEIGRLAEMFNHLRLRLDDAVSQIAGEKNKLETVLRHMADGLLAVDLSGKIIHINEAAIRILKPISDQIGNEDYDSLMLSFNPDLGLENLKERCIAGADNEIFEVGGNTYDMRFDRFRDENGIEIGVIMIIQDITQRIKSEKMQMDFVVNVSHELKTPLTTIKSYTETLLDTVSVDLEIEKQFLEIIDAETDRMNRLVKDLLQLFRMESHQDSLIMNEGNIILLLSNVIRNIELTAAAKNQKVNCLFDANKLIYVVMQRDRIEQVILNIISNAIKYTQDGGRIDIDAFVVGKEARITVTDNGIGIPESELARVFERFFRIDKARARDMGGTGLGLSISKQIMENHGGSIELDSKEGKGTRVTIILPVAPRMSRGTPNIE
ncbi:MAG: ATP-binding protein [Eubacteriales bacterium]|nr:ATP-binding protein [Eubacteriales bacterium]